MISESDAVLVRTALEITDGNVGEAMRLLRNECGWSLLESRRKIETVKAYEQRMRGE